MNYFELLGIEEAFSIDSNLLRKNYLQRSRDSHPDLVGILAEANLDHSSELNAAYETLKNPVLRILYILNLNDISVDAKSVLLPQDFLMEMMDINEEIEEAKGSDHLMQKANQKLNALNSDLESEYKEVLDHYSLKSKNAEVLDSMRSYYMKNNYLKRLQMILNNENDL
jgi:molecular chaperone HscB